MVLGGMPSAESVTPAAKPQLDSYGHLWLERRLISI
jgi:hypothetical protein